MASFVDVCRFTAVSSGTGNFVVSAAVTGYQTPASAGAVNGSIYRYRAESADLSQWEVGFGAYTSGSTTLARTTVLYNSSGGSSAINFSAAPQVAIVALAADLVSLNALTGDLTIAEGNGIEVDTSSPTITVTQNAPSFAVHLSSNQSVSTGTNTRVDFDVVDVDTHSWWDATNKRYTPQQPGKYLFAMTVTAAGTFVAGSTVLSNFISKNGTIGGTGVALLNNFTYAPNAAGGSVPGGSIIVDMNGSTDFVEVDVNFGGTSPVVQGLAAPNIRTTFCGTRVAN